MICSRCGLECPEGSVFCNKCGAKLDESISINADDKDDTSHTATIEQGGVGKINFVRNIISKITGISSKKKIIIGVFLSITIIAGVGYKIIAPPLPEKVFEKIKSYNAKEETSYLDKVYPSNGGFLGLFKEQNRKNKGIVLSLLIKSVNDQFQNVYGRSIDDYNAVKISHVDIKNENYNSDYVDINVIVDNNGKTPVNYIKINLYYKDDSGKVIRSDWTNDDSVIQPGASQVITKMTENDGWKSVHAEIAEIR